MEAQAALLRQAELSGAICKHSALTLPVFPKAMRLPCFFRRRIHGTKRLTRKHTANSLGWKDSARHLKIGWLCLKSWKQPRT